LLLFGNVPGGGDGTPPDTARLPFGGVGNSGMGRYHGHDSFDAFSLRRGVVESPARPDLPLRYPPYKGFRWVKKIL